MVPVSVRAASESLALGNRVSSLFVELAVAEPDPLLRYRKIAAAAEELKRGDAVAGTESVIRLAGLAPPVIQSVVARLAFTPRLFNLTITNVPASPVTLYSAGAPMTRIVPLVPIFSGHAVGVAVVSYDGTVTFGLNADRDTVPDLDVMRAGIEESLAELTARRRRLGRGAEAGGPEVAVEAGRLGLGEEAVERSRRSAAGPRPGAGGRRCRRPRGGCGAAGCGPPRRGWRG